MKKTICICAFLIFTFSGFTQAVDTAAVVREVDGLYRSADSLLTLGKPKEAVSLCEYAKNLAERTIGKGNMSYARCNFLLGFCYSYQSQNKLALQYLSEAKEGIELIQGKMNLDYAKTLSSLGNTDRNLGQFDKAEAEHLEALDILKNIAGEGSAAYASALHNLAILYRHTMRYEMAEKSYKKVAGIQMATLGENNPDYLRTLNNLSILYNNWGRLAEAEVILLQVLEKRKEVQGPEHPEYAATMSYLASNYLWTGQYLAAERYYLEASKIYQKKFGTESARYAEAVYNLATLYWTNKQYQKAETCAIESKLIYEKLAGDEHLVDIKSSILLGGIYQAMRRYNDAEQYFLKAKAALEKKEGKDGYNYSTLIVNLGILYIHMGRFEEAEPLLLDGIKIKEKLLGNENPDYFLALYNLGGGYRKYGRAQDEVKVYAEAIQILQKFYKNIARHTTETGLFSFQKSYKSTICDYFSVLYDHPSESLLADHAFDLSLLSKNFLLESRMKILNGLSVADSSTLLIYNDWSALQRRLSAEYAKPIAARKNPEVLESQADNLEKILVLKINGFSEAQRTASWTAVQSALRPGEAALELIHFNFYNPGRTDSILYAALLLKPGMQHPVFIPLCEERQLKELLPAADGKLNNDQVNELYSNGALYRLLWPPLESHLVGVRTVYYSPSGLLHRLNLAALPASPQNRLADRYDMVALGSTRQLATANTTATATATAIVYGGIHFDMDSTTHRERPSDHTSGQRGLSFAQTDSTLRGDTWNFLKWSEKEADNIQAALEQAGINTQVIKGRQATEESFKQMGQTGQSPRILHISTHGFFFPDPADPQSEIRNPQPQESVFKLSDHPMIRSGLILAGANHAWKTGRPLGNREDGILTAYEISQLDLRNTELVVLSACETGLGHIEGNEGVYGLQRAFKIAGAKTVVMSLWQVPDYQTQELMTVFYQKWLLGKIPVRQALQSAQKEMRDKGYEPYYWAGFVVVE